MGQGLWFISSIAKDTKTPEYRERRPRSHLTNTERRAAQSSLAPATHVTQLQQHAPKRAPGDATKPRQTHSRRRQGGGQNACCAHAPRRPPASHATLAG